MHTRISARAIGQGRRPQDHKYRNGNKPETLSASDLATLKGAIFRRLGDVRRGIRGSKIVSDPATRRGEGDFVAATPMATSSGIMLDLGTFGGPTSLPTAINNLGWVVGGSFTADTAEGFRAFLWIEGEGMRQVSFLLGSATDVNDLGQVTGSALVGREQHGFLWTAGQGAWDMGTLPGGKGSTPVAINESGQVVGWGGAQPGRQHAFRWTQAGGMLDLGTLGGRLSYARDLNASGQVVVESVDGNNDWRLFRWSDVGGIRDLGTLPGSYLQPLRHDPIRINDSGQVMANIIIAGGNKRAARWTEAHGWQNLGTLGGPDSEATAINALGQIVGSSYTAAGKRHAFLWTDTDGMRDLGTLGGPVSRAGQEPQGQGLSYAINASGEVTGSSLTADGQQHAFRWSDAKGMEDLGTLGGTYSEGTNINASGQVTGSSLTAAGAQHAFRWASS